MLGKTVMLVEDDAAVANVVSLYLKNYGFTVTLEENGAKAAQRILQESPDAVILDGILPGMSGVDVCRQVRNSFRAPIIMLTSMDEDADHVVALELGADDYIVKPAEPRVILAHLKACLRRAAGIPAPVADQLCFGRLVISQVNRTVVLDGQTIAMTDSEFDLLFLLAKNAGRVLSRDDIYEQLRGLDYDGLDRSIDMRISRLRKHLHDDSTRPTRIKTVRSKGYLFSGVEWA